MDITNQRRCLAAIAGGLLVGTAAAIGWSLSGINTPSPISKVGQGQQVQPAISSDNLQSFDERIAARTLRGPLYDSPAAPSVPVARPKPTPTPQQPKLDLTLVGTIIEANQSIAILSDSAGQFDVKGIGESLELLPAGVTVQKIEAEQVTLQYQGRQSTVQLDRSAKESDGRANQRGNNRRKNR
jgi:type II secretory pathway component PulC